MQGFISLTLRLDPAEEGGFVAHCPELDVVSQGESVEEAMTNIKDACLTFLETIEELGDADQFFLDHGIKLEPKAPAEVKNVKVTTGEVVSVLAASVGSGATFAS